MAAQLPSGRGSATSRRLRRPCQRRRRHRCPLSSPPALALAVRCRRTLLGACLLCFSEGGKDGRARERHREREREREREMKMSGEVFDEVDSLRKENENACCVCCCRLTRSLMRAGWGALKKQEPHERLEKKKSGVRRVTVTTRRTRARWIRTPQNTEVARSCQPRGDPSHQ